MSERCPQCGEPTRSHEWMCPLTTPTGSPSTPAPDTATEFERQCQADFDEYRKAYPECHGYDFGHAWRAGRKWTLANDPLVRQMADCLGMLDHVGVGEPYDRIVREALEAYRHACEGKT